MIQANQDTGNISLNNLAVLKPLTYARTETAGSISVTGTVAGSVTQVLARAGGSVNVSGTAGSVTRAEASHGSISVNGGTGHVSITKLMAGTLTTGAFNQVNVLHAAPVSKTCTAANNGRADYLGLVSSVPIV